MTTTQTSREALNLEEATAYIQENARFFTPEEMEKLESLDSDSWGCIDDRNRRESDLIAIPGSGLGVLMDAIAGMGLLAKIHTRGRLSVPAIDKIVRSVIGTPSYHTDEAAVERHDPLACAGCGHCGGALKEAEIYLLDDKEAAYLRNEYIPTLSQEKDPAVYAGTHDSQAVFVVDGLDIRVPFGNDSTQAYVYSKSWHLKALRTIAEKIAEKIASLHQQADLDAMTTEITEALYKASQIRLDATVEHLAAHLPTYIVSSNEGAITVSAA